MLSPTQSTELCIGNEREMQQGPPREWIAKIQQWCPSPTQSRDIFNAPLFTNQKMNWFLNCGIIYIESKSPFLVYGSVRFDKHIQLCNHHSCVANTIKILQHLSLSLNLEIGRPKFNSWICHFQAAGHLLLPSHPKYGFMSTLCQSLSILPEDWSQSLVFKLRKVGDPLIFLKEQCYLR